jgi:hypothetical protein
VIDTGMFSNVLTSLPIALLITRVHIQYNIVYEKDTENTITFRVVNTYEGGYMERPLTLVLKQILLQTVSAAEIYLAED